LSIKRSIVIGEPKAASTSNDTKKKNTKKESTTIKRKVAKEALETNRSVYDIVLEKELMTKEKLDEALDPKNMLVSHKFIK